MFLKYFSSFCQCKAALHLVFLLLQATLFSAQQTNLAIKSSSINTLCPFVVIVCSYNNEPFVERNLRSIFKQRYTNFRVIYIDDASTDGTYEIAKLLIDRHRGDVLVDLHSNRENLGAMENIYRAVHSCENGEIIVLVDGDDWLPDRSDVLDSLSAYYQDDGVWMTYGTYREWPSGSSGGNNAPVLIKDLKRRAMRGGKWRTSHLKTFYAGLFKQISEDDFKREGAFFSTASDVAFMYPMLEMAQERARYISEIMYIYNTSNPHSDFLCAPREQLEMRDYIRRLPRYPRLEIDPRL